VKEKDKRKKELGVFSCKLNAAHSRWYVRINGNAELPAM
jgi:hypothetical protein